jgi:hypothetical protein
MAREIALLSPDILKTLEDPESFYTVGWSHGKEIFAGKPDKSKGSFYANPLVDDLAMVRKVDKCIVEKNPSFFAKNLWPKYVPGVEPAFKDLGSLVINVGRLLAKPCDAYVAQQVRGYNPDTLETVLTGSKFAKGRLLHYFPMHKQPTSSEADEFGDWCGWHNDHVSPLTCAHYMP